MDEKLLQYIWKHKLFATNDLKTVSGEGISIKNFGVANLDSGPDYVNAKIMINNTLWAGCVELHLKSSDWEKHNHQHDNAYSNVVLHAVYEHDKDIFAADGSLLPTLELKPLINPQLIDTYRKYMDSLQDIVCQNQFGGVDSFRLFSWLDRLLIERLEDEPDVRVIKHIKSSLAPEGSPLAFRIERDSSIRFLETYEGENDYADVLEDGKREWASNTILSLLSSGPRPGVDIQRICADAGISESTVNRAKKDLGIRSVRKPDGWDWTLMGQK